MFRRIIMMGLCSQDVKWLCYLGWISIIAVCCPNPASAQLPSSNQVSSRDFNLLWDDVDANGFPLDPYWSFQSQPGNKGQVPNSDHCGSGLPNASNCTDQ